MEKVNLNDKLAQFTSHWDPHVVADYNGNDIMVVKFAGEFPFHKHVDSDDFFLVLDGEITVDVVGQAPVVMGPGELCVVPRGAVHRPRAETEAKVLLIEPAGLPNTGDAATAAAKPRI